MSRTTRLAVVLALNAVLVTGLVVVGVTAHSLGVLAAGADYLADAAAIAISLLAIWLSKLTPTTKRPQGYPRATTFAALVIGGWLMVLSVLVGLGAIDRLATRTPVVHALPVLIVSAIASVAMGIGVVILRGDGDTDGDDDGGKLTMRAVVLDTAADAAVAAGVAIAGAIILITGHFYWLDPTVALGIAVVVGNHALALLHEVVRTLMEPVTIPPES